MRWLTQLNGGFNPKLETGCNYGSLFSGRHVCPTVLILDMLMEVLILCCSIHEHWSHLFSFSKDTKYEDYKAKQNEVNVCQSNNKSIHKWKNSVLYPEYYVNAMVIPHYKLFKTWQWSETETRQMVKETFRPLFNISWKEAYLFCYINTHRGLLHCPICLSIYGNTDTRVQFWQPATSCHSVAKHIISYGPSD